jgi:hypothetical protein
MAIAPEIGCKLAGITGLMLRKLPHALTRKGFVYGDRRRQKLPAPDSNDSLSSASKRGETRALACAMYIEGRGEEKSCKCP